MKIATYNINNIRRRLPRLLEWMAEAAPDVVCLQELGTTAETGGSETPGCGSITCC